MMTKTRSEILDLIAISIMICHDHSVVPSISYRGVSVDVRDLPFFEMDSSSLREVEVLLSYTVTEFMLSKNLMPFENYYEISEEVDEL